MTPLDLGITPSTYRPRSAIRVAISRVVDFLLACAGLRLRCVPLDGWHVGYIRQLGFTPKTVVDVGVGRGTEVLYRSFPDAFHVLIEPLVEFEPDLQKILNRYKGEYHLTALGDTRGTSVLYVDPKWPERSSLMERAAPEKPEVPLSSRTVPVTTLDALLQERKWVPPFGLKLDIEGAEDMVIRGAQEFLRHTQFVIAELPVADRFFGGYMFADFIKMMDEREFRICDFLEVGRNPAFDISFVDVIFRRTDHIDIDTTAGGTSKGGRARHGLIL